MKKQAYRKDGLKRQRLSLSVTPQSVEEARKIDPNISRAFEKAFTKTK